MNNNANASGTSIIHADPHPLLRFGVKLILKSQSDCHYLAECNSAKETLSKISELKPDLLLLELALADQSGIEVIQKLRGESTPVKILVLSSFEDEATVRQALHSGIDGYIFKSSSPDQLASAVAAVRNDRELVLPDAMSHLRDYKAEELSTNGNNSNSNNMLDPLGQLSKREREVFYLLAEGHPNRVIAKQLFISPRTVETHRARVIKKLGFDNTADLIRYAIRNSLMPL